jgi:hypothetical protein
VRPEYENLQGAGGKVVCVGVRHKAGEGAGHRGTPQELLPRSTHIKPNKRRIEASVYLTRVSNKTKRRPNMPMYVDRKARVMVKEDAARWRVRCEWEGGNGTRSSAPHHARQPRTVTP